MSDEYQADDVVETQPELLPEDVEGPGEDKQKSMELEKDTTALDVELPSIVSSAPEQQKKVTVPSVVSLADLEKTPRSKKSSIPSLSGVGQVFQGRTWLAGLLIAALIIVFLFLPPVSIGKSLLGGGRFTALNADNPSLRHDDGLTFVQYIEENGNLRVKLDTIPQAHFNTEMVSKEFVTAVETLPDNLEPKSPFYIIEVKGKKVVASRIEVDIPNAAEPWETLDLYSWNGEQWLWLPSYLDRNAFLLIAEVQDTPTSVIVMQNRMAPPRVAVEVDEVPTTGIDASINEANVTGLLIGTMGGTAGDATKLPLASDLGSTDIVPVIRNWIPGREANPGLVKDMLSFDADRQNHIQELLGIAQSGGYPGLILDYKNLDATLRDSYALFIRDLAQAFHESTLWLAVVVDTPVQNSDGEWETSGYDWIALGAAVDQLRITMPASPGAYSPGGQAEQLITWAVSQVNRNKVYLLYSTLSLDATGPVGQNEIYESFGNVMLLTSIDDVVNPGTALSFTLDKPISANMDSATGATSLTLENKTYWLGTPKWLHTRMGLTHRYALGGVVLRDLYAEGNIPGQTVAIADYLAQIDTLPYSLPTVIWQISDPQNQITEMTTYISQPQMDWVAPEMTGTYRILASVAGLDNGFVDIEVIQSNFAVTDTIASDDEGVAGGAGAEIVDDDDEDDEDTGEQEDTTVSEQKVLKAGFVADVTVPDNTRFEKGEQFTKTWRMRNAGNVDWPADTVLRFSSGTQMASVDEITIGSVAIGEDVDISVDMVAPDEDGSFKSTWQLSTEAGDITNGSIYVIIQAGEQAAAPQPAPQPSVPAPAPGATGSFELGGHVRDLGMPFSDKMHYAGMNWAKTQIHFGQDAVGMVNAAHAKGFKIQLSAIGGAGMVTEAGYEQKFASWLASLASAGADAIEVWNEPNIDREWQIGLINPQAYTNLLCTSYNAIKAANPGTAVISAAPSPTGWFGGCGPNGCDDQPWMEGLWNAGAANCMDYIGAHHNAGATSPSARSGHPADNGGNHHSWYFLPQTELYYNIFRGSRQIFYTEMGYASQEGVSEFSEQFWWGRGTNNAEQAAWLSEAVQLSINTGMVRSIVVWNIDFVRYGYDPQDGYAIIRPGGGCPACDSLHNILGTR